VTPVVCFEVESKPIQVMLRGLVSCGSLIWLLCNRLIGRYEQQDVTEGWWLEVSAPGLVECIKFTVAVQTDS